VWSLASWTVALAAALAAASQPTAQTLPAGLLARPITPASVALLVLDVKSPDVQQRLNEALRADRAEVRAVAARVVAATASRGQTATLSDTLARETDGAAAREQVRALLVLDAANPAIAAAVDRHGGLVAAAFAESLARDPHADLLSQLQPLLQKRVERALLADLLSVVVRDRPGELTRVSLGVAAAADGLLWRAYLSRLGRYDIEPGDDVWLSGLGATDPGVRAATLFVVAERLIANTRVSSAVRRVALPPADWPPPAPTEVDLARELVARASGKKPSAFDWAPLVEAGGGRVPFGLWPKLTYAEREAARRASFTRGEKGTGKDYDPPGKTRNRVEGLAPRTIRPTTAGLFSEIASLTGCQPADRTEYAAAKITYHANGRPKEVTLASRTIRPECRELISTAMLLLTARQDQPLLVAPTDVVFLPLERTRLSCVDALAPDVSPIVAEEPGVTMPAVVKEARPRYSAEAMGAKVQGEVHLSVIISDTGCVASAEVMRTLHPDLDLEALNAAMQWQFTPPQRDARPMPMLVTMSIGFKLK
jgi:TonB family protein